MIALPENPIAAVTHPDPYPYYARLLASRPLYRDADAGYWVASSAATVTAVLTSDLCQVRPHTEPVPAALLASPAANVFHHLVRMNDGQRHDALKGALERSLQSIGPDQLARQSAQWAGRLISEMQPQSNPAHLTDFAFYLPIYVVASLLGISEEDLAQTTRWINDFAHCLAPLSSPEQVEQGKQAASHLLSLLQALPRALATSSLLSTLVQEAQEIEYANEEVIIANAIGLLFQTYEATAGLIGNTLLTLARQPQLLAQVLNKRDLLSPVLQEVLRYDPPIQNTRRFVVRQGEIAGEQLQEGDMILLVLAAANRDPAINPDPERFSPLREERRCFTFGSASHACPGEHIATIIAGASIEQLLISGFDSSGLGAAVRYRPSGNARIPLFSGEEV